MGQARGTPRTDAGRNGHPILIGLCGRAGAGKNTVADLICELVPGAQQYALAGPLKDMAFAIDPLIEVPGGATIHLATLVRAQGWDLAKRHPEVRRFLQRLGTEGVRGTFGRETWTDLMWQWWEGSSSWVGVVTDVRFQDEADQTDVILRIDRAGTDLVGENASHASEQEVSADYRIPNNGSLDDLRDEVRHFLTLEGVL